MHARLPLVAGLIAVGLLPGCDRDGPRSPDAARTPPAEEVREQFFQGAPAGFEPEAPAEVVTEPDEFAAMSDGWWSPEDDRARAIEDSLDLIEGSGFEAGTALRYPAKDPDRFVFGAVMAVDDPEQAAAEVAERVEAIAGRPCPWACVEDLTRLRLPAEGRAVGFSVLREIRPGGTRRSAVDQRQLYVTWMSGDYVHLALLIDDAQGRGADAFTRFVADEILRTTAL